MNKYDEMVVRITIFCREPLNFGLFFQKVKVMVQKNSISCLISQKPHVRSAAVIFEKNLLRGRKKDSAALR